MTKRLKRALWLQADRSLWAWQTLKEVTHGTIGQEELDAVYMELQTACINAKEALAAEPDSPPTMDTRLRR